MLLAAGCYGYWAPTADKFAGGCKDSTSGVASQFGAFLGKIATGSNAGNDAIATIVPTGVQITIGTPSFTVASTSNIAIGDPAVLSSTSLATADLNGDGIADLVVASAGSTFANPIGTLTVFLGKSDGTFAAAKTINLPFNVQGFTIDDLNKDGKLDIVAVAYMDVNAGVSHLAVLLRHGDGTFAAPVLGPANVTGNNVVTGDFNGDGKKDVATTDGYVLLGNGDGTFTVPFAKQFLTQFIGIAAGDFNGDGKTDLAITTDVAHGTVISIPARGTDTSPAPLPTRACTVRKASRRRIWMATATSIYSSALIRGPYFPPMSPPLGNFKASWVEVMKLLRLPLRSFRQHRARRVLISPTSPAMGRRIWCSWIRIPALRTGPYTQVMAIQLSRARRKRR